MAKAIGFLTAALLACSILVPASVQAQWILNGTAICTQAGNQHNLRMVPDGFGGSIVVWQDFRSGDWNIYAQRIDAYGRSQWGAGGVAVCSVPGLQQEPRIASDGSGGAVVMYVDRSSPANEVYLQRVTGGTGAAAWGAGVRVCTVPDSLLSVDMAGDGSGGAFVVWQDIRVDSLGFDVFSQMVGSDGSPQWAPAGVAVCNLKEDQYDPRAISDGAGGALIAWTDMRSGSNADIYAQRLDATGAPHIQWMPGGTVIVAEAHDQGEATLATDGANGAIVVWVDRRAGSPDIYASRITGNRISPWGELGIAVCAASGEQSDPRIVSDGAGGALVAWSDLRTGGADIFAQKIDASGAVKWIPDGAGVCVASGDQTGHSIAMNGAGGAIVAWGDERNALESDIYAQMIGAGGIAQWALNGIEVCAAAGTQEWPAIAEDGAGGALIAWADVRGEVDHDVYCQRIERNGYWGFPAPEIFAVRDVPGDQGGMINLAWDASRLDPWPNQDILNYSIWRAIDPVQAAELIGGGAAVVEEASRIAASSDVPQIRIEHAASGDYYWKFISYLYAAALEHYSENIATLFDSTAVCDERHYFQVIAHQSGGTGFWASAPDSGYSVDNLAPAMPCSVTARQLGDDLRVAWRPNAETDLSCYALFKGATEDFVPLTPVLLTTDTMAVDTAWTPSSNDDYYKLVAFDIHGNASAPALLRPGSVVATLLQSFSAAVASPGVRIEWRLAECDPDARFIVSRAAAGADFVDLAGAAPERAGLAFTFVDRSVEPGTTYRYRVAVDRGEETSVLFETSPISIPAAPLTLHQNLPNPFNPSTTIGYYLPAAARVRLDVFDASGRHVAALVARDETKGLHSVSWNGRNGLGDPVSSGVYFYVLRAGKESATKKMVLLR